MDKSWINNLKLEYKKKELEQLTANLAFEALVEELKKVKIRFKELGLTTEECCKGLSKLVGSKHGQKLD